MNLMSLAVDEYELTAANRFEAPLIVPAAGGVSWSLTQFGPFLFSVVTHLGLLLTLALYGVPEDQKSGRRLLLSAPVNAASFDDMPTIAEITPHRQDVSDAMSVAVVSENLDVGESLPAPLTVVATGRRQLSPSALDGVMGLFDGAGDGLGETGTGQGGAEFFGVQASGRRFVFVVDSSRSMRGRKWTLACTELLASVKRMRTGQSFYVIFFDVDTHPMFSQRRPEPELLPVNKGNQKKLSRWLPSIKLGPDTRPLDSMRLALTMKPDAIFLLSDGEFNDGTRSFLLSENRREDDDGNLVPRIPIHTVGFYSIAAEAVLKPIAADHGGGYRFIGK